MSLKIFFLSFLLVAPPVLGIPIDDNGKELQNSENLFDEVRSGETYSLESELRELLELFRKLLKEGNPDNGISPMEPLLLAPSHFDFFMEDTTLAGMMRNVVIRNLSDFEMKNLKVSLVPKSLNATVLLPEVFVTGWHKFVGILFGEFPIDHVGTHRISVTNATISGQVSIKIKAGIVQITDLSADFDVSNISVAYTNSDENDREEQVPESIVKDLLNRFRQRYLSLLINTGKLVLNDFLARLPDEEELVQILSLFTKIIKILSGPMKS